MSGQGPQPGAQTGTRVGARTGSFWHETAGLGLLGPLPFVIAGLCVRTLRALAAGKVCVPE